MTDRHTTDQSVTPLHDGPMFDFSKPGPWHTTRVTAVPTGKPFVTKWRDVTTMILLKGRPGWLRRAWYWCTRRQWGYVRFHTEDQT